MPSEEFIRKNYIQEGGSRAVLKRIDPEYMDDVDGYVGSWFEDVKEVVKYDNSDIVSEETFNKSSIRKQALAGLLGEVFSIVEQQREIVKDLRTANDLLKTELIESQSTVTKIQSELMKCNTEQFQSLQTTVKSTVQDTVQSEMKSYSSVLSEKSQPAAISPEILKKVVQAVVKEEDRGRNLMIFGLEEEKGEILLDKVSEVFLALDEKPTIAASRVGKKRAGKARPVKVTLTGNTSVNQILSKARRLRTVQKHKCVFISPDRSPDQRAEHKQLVLDLKKRITEQPNKRHFIRQGQIIAVDKTC